MGAALCLPEEHGPFPPTHSERSAPSDYCVPESLVREADVNIPVL